MTKPTDDDATSSAESLLAAHDAISRPEHVLSITDFLTDGALVRVCDQLSSIYGRSIQLRDASGCLIRASTDRSGWTVLHDTHLDPLSARTRSFRIMAGGEAIGSITVSPPLDIEGGGSADPAPVVSLLAQTASEFCEQELRVRHRARELAALEQLSNMLVGMVDSNGVINAALDAALDLLSLDAGSVVVLPRDADGISSSDDEKDLVLRAARRLSSDWLESSIPLSRDRLFDVLALKGELVISEDLLADERVLIPDRVESERLGSCIHAGLVAAGRPIGVLRLYGRTPRRFTSSDRRLVRAIAEHAAAAVERARLHRVRAREERNQEQLKLAAEIQRRTLPRELPQLPGVDLAARWIPTFELGGDFYDAFRLEGGLVLALGDAVGKGLPASLLSANARATLRAIAPYHDDPGEIMQRVNRAICRDTLPSEFVSALLASYDRSSRLLRVASAGHEPPILLRPGETPRPLDFTGDMVLGVLADANYSSFEFPMQVGDALLIYSDGVPDTINFEGDRFRREGLIESLAELQEADAQAPAELIAKHVLWSLRRFSGLAEQTDDRTMLILRVTE